MHVDDAGIRRSIERYGTAVGPGRGIGSPKGAKNGRRGRSGLARSCRGLVGDVVNESRSPQRVSICRIGHMMEGRQKDKGKKSW